MKGLQRITSPGGRCHPAYIFAKEAEGCHPPLPEAHISRFRNTPPGICHTCEAPYKIMGPARKTGRIGTFFWLSPEIARCRRYSSPLYSILTDNKNMKYQMFSHIIVQDRYLSFSLNRRPGAQPSPKRIRCSDDRNDSNGRNWLHASPARRRWNRPRKMYMLKLQNPAPGQKRRREGKRVSRLSAS